MQFIIITDDSSAQAELRKILREEFPVVQVRESSNDQEWMELLQQEVFALAIISARDKDYRLAQIFSTVQQRFPKLSLLAIGSQPEPIFLPQLLAARAAGYLYKDAVSKELVKAVRIILQERHYLPLYLEKKLSVHQDGHFHKLPHEELSAREYDVFKSLAAGKSVSEIAHTNVLGVTTVSTYRSRLLAKMGLKTNAEIIAYAKRYQLV